MVLECGGRTAKPNLMGMEILVPHAYNFIIMVELWQKKFWGQNFGVFVYFFGSKIGGPSRRGFITF
jgi:hypothetical protein